MRHRKPTQIGFASIAAAVALLVGGASPATAATVKPTIDIHHHTDTDGDYLDGWIRTSVSGCKAFRYPFLVFRKQPGKDQLFQKLQTYDDGYWRTNPTPRGTYYAKLKRFTYDGVVCEKARSADIKVP